MSEPHDELARAAIDSIESGWIVGLGTGRAASRAIKALADRVNNEGLNIRCVPTSVATEALARDLALAVDPFRDTDSIDLLFDGADEFDDHLRMLKGGGGAMTREKIAALCAKRCVYLVQESKRVSRLGERFPLPIEVREPAIDSVHAALADRGFSCVIRAHEGGRFTTDNGNPILDVTLDRLFDVEELSRWLDRLRGVVGHGLFLTEADEIIVEGERGAIQRLTRS